MKIVFATANAGKLREAAEVLGPDFEIVSLAQAGITEDIPETGSTLQENSLQKAQYLFERTGLPCFADDTGLEVEDLGGAPAESAATAASAMIPSFCPTPTRAAPSPKSRKRKRTPSPTAATPSVKWQNGLKPTGSKPFCKIRLICCAR